MYINIGELSLSYLPTRQTPSVCSTAQHTSCMLQWSSSILAPEWTVCAGSYPLGKGAMRTIGQSIINPCAKCRIAAGSRGWSSLLSACCGHCGRVMLTVTGPSSKGILITVLQAKRRPVTSILTRRLESGESGETCCVKPLEPLPPIDLHLTVWSRDLALQRRALPRESSRVNLNAALSTPSAARMALIAHWSTLDSSVSMWRSVGTMVPKLRPPRDRMPL